MFYKVHHCKNAWVSKSVLIIVFVL